MRFRIYQRHRLVDHISLNIVPPGGYLVLLQDKLLLLAHKEYVIIQ
jgi:hypothetical protein